MLTKSYLIYFVIVGFYLCFVECDKKNPTKSDNKQKKYKIAYCSTQDSWGIFLMDTDGSNSKKLTQHGKISTDPAWSPDGSRLIYISSITNQFNDGVYIINNDGTNSRLLSDINIDVVYSPLWSPAGNRISFVSSSNYLYLVNADGRNQSQLTSNCYSPAKWHPDGTKLVFYSWRGFETGVGVINSDGTGFKLLSDKNGDGEPDWSPDGNSITFVSNRDENVEIYTMDYDGTNQQRLTNNNADDSSPVWSPDGSKIAFVSNRDDQNYEIYVMNGDGSNQMRESNVPRYIYITPPSWSPDATKIIFVEAEDRYGCSYCDIWIVNADGTDQKKLTDNEEIDADPAWSPVPVF